VAFVLGHMANFDRRLQRTAFTSNIKNRRDLQSELQVFNLLKSQSNTPNWEPEAKRAKAMEVKCYRCGKLGHKKVDCRFGTGYKSSSAGGERRSGEPFHQGKHDQHLSQGKPKVTCYRCREPGHIAPNCPKNVSTGGTGSRSEKRVELCVVDEPKSFMMIQGEKFPISFDSGAECSLAKESISNKIVGKRTNNVISLKGIGNANIYSTVQIESNAIIDGNCLEILFHVVPDDCMKNNVVIGREVLAQGFTAEISYDGFKIVRSKIVNACNLSDPVNFDNLETEVVADERVKLISLLKKYSTSFIEGTPQTRVGTGEMCIRLLEPTKTVQRRPYRLSPSEREIVRAKINELIESKVIRPSSSPFASPALIVKKKNGSARLCVDYRELNSNTVADKFPLPLISDQIARLRGAKYFTSLDMASGYYQIPMHPESIEYTAFVVVYFKSRSWYLYN